jgi:hypothetical protein
VRQAVLSGAIAMTFLCNIDDTLFKSMQAPPPPLKREERHLKGGETGRRDSLFKSMQAP